MAISITASLCVKRPRMLRSKMSTTAIIITEAQKLSPIDTQVARLQRPRLPAP